MTLISKLSISCQSFINTSLSVFLAQQSLTFHLQLLSFSISLPHVLMGACRFTPSRIPEARPVAPRWEGDGPTAPGLTQRSRSELPAQVRASSSRQPIIC